VLGQGKALRYGIGVGRERFTWGVVDDDPAGKFTLLPLIL
jgi:hypothetical protein